MSNRSDFNRKEWEAKIIAHAWKDEKFKRELLANPQAALKHFGYNLPEKLQINVVEEHENAWTLVLPKAPVGSSHLSEADLSRAPGGTQSSEGGQECTVNVIGCNKAGPPPTMKPAPPC